MFLPSNITLKFGDSGDFVAELQRRLAMVQCFSNDQVNGFYDGSTVNGVMMFQGMSGLHADGVAGPETLRRLNGVIAGDTSGSTDDKKEEEEKQLATRDAGLINMALAEQPQPGIWGEPAPQEQHAPVQEAAPQPQAPLLDPARAAPAITAVFAPSPQDQAFLAQRDQMLQNPAQELNNLMQQQQQQMQQEQMQARNAPPPLPMEQRSPELQSVARQADPIPLPPQQQMQQQPVVEPVVEPQQQQGGLVARAGRFANAMMQKLSDYFEAKLPPSVMADVKAAGAIMAAAGLKEAPIPTGPEMAGPAQQLPARGPEQQPTQQRG